VLYAALDRKEFVKSAAGKTSAAPLPEAPLLGSSGH